MGSGVKHDSGKLPFHLLPPRALTAVAERLKVGAEKYGERNWEAGLDWHRCFAAAQRHLWAWWGGEDLDPDTPESFTDMGKSHLAAAICMLLFLLEYAETHPELDDRPYNESGRP